MKFQRALLCSTALFAVACNQATKTEEKKAAGPSFAVVGSIVRSDPAFDALVPASATIERIAKDHKFTEGPLYYRDGYLLFSDIPQNTIFKWTPDGIVNVFRRPSGYDGTDAPAGALVGSNGLTRDKEGRLIICEHGNRRVTRLEKEGSTPSLVTILADKFEGKKLNSPNDVVVKSDGSIYFTDPPYGFPKEDADPKKELKFNGIFRLKDGKLQLLAKELKRPNGIGFSPDEKTLYISNSDPDRKIWMKYDVKNDGTIANGKVFFDVTKETEDGLPDGLKIDKKGNIYGSGPGGIWVFSPEGKHLGTIKPPETPANCAWGKYTTGDDNGKMSADEDGDTLYMTARTGVYRIKLSTAGRLP
jgi:gluconolactonase